MKSFAALGLFLLCFFFTSFAAAQGANKALAEGLFSEGRKLMDEGKYDEACKKFADSYKLDHAIGTQLNLALCYKKAGKTASAWSTFKSAAGAANQAGQQDRVELADREAAALEPNLKYVVVEVPDAARVDGLEVRLDGAMMPPASWGAALPVDPGPHELSVTAPGHEPSKQSFNADDKQTKVTVPVLAASETEQAPAETGEDNSQSAKGSVSTEDVAQGGDKTLAWVAYGVGAAGIIAGVVGLVVAGGASSDLKKQCDADKLCPPSAQSDIDKEGTFKTIGLTGFIVGGVGLAAGTGLLVWSSSDQEQPVASAAGSAVKPRATVEAYVGLGHAGLRGTF